MVGYTYILGGGGRIAMGWKKEDQCVVWWLQKGGKNQKGWLLTVNIY